MTDDDEDDTVDFKSNFKYNQTTIIGQKQQITNNIKHK